MKVKCFLALLCFCGLWGCNRGVENGNLPFTIDDAVSLQGEVIYEKLFWGRPSRLCVADSFLYAVDDYDDKLLTVLNLNTGQTRRLIDYGEGPQELMQIRTISYNAERHELGLYDGRVDRESFYSIAGDSLLFERSESFHRGAFKNYTFYDVVPLGDGYLGNGCFEHGEQFIWFRGGEKEPLIFGEYPGDKTGIEQNAAFFMKTQTLLAVNPNQQYFAAAGCYHDQLVFYRREGDRVRKLKEYFSIEARLKTRYKRTEKGEMAGTSLLPETMLMYEILYPTESHLYAVYYGKSNEERKEETQSHCYILKFSWTGECQKSYKLDYLTTRLAVDEANQCIYTIRLQDEDYVLMKYAM